MAEKIRLTRPELKRRRAILARFERYLPVLKLKQQLLQTAVRQAVHKWQEVELAVENVKRKIDRYRAVMADTAGVDVIGMSEPVKVHTRETSVAGIKIPVFLHADFDERAYSLFATPPWVDQAIAEHRELNLIRADAGIQAQGIRILRRELTRVNQRLNLFEKVMIPKTKKAIHRIRIYLGDEQTAAVGRAKIAKGKQVALRKGKAVI